MSCWRALLISPGPASVCGERVGGAGGRGGRGRGWHPALSSDLLACLGWIRLGPAAQLRALRLAGVGELG